MKTDDHVETKPASPEYVLNVLIDNQRQQCLWDPEADPDVVLSFEMTVADWRDACDLVAWRALGRALNNEWQLGYSDSEWHDVLRPPHLRTLRDVCNLIAARAVSPEVIPAKILGKECLSAGAFFAICSRLRSAGVDVSDIAPSTPLHEYTRQHAGVFLQSISRLAPNALPEVNIENPWYDRCLAGFGVSLVVGVVSFFLSRWLPVLSYIGCLSVLVGILSFSGIWIAVRHPKAVEFGELRTFRDLAKLIADRSPHAAIGG